MDTHIQQIKGIRPEQLSGATYKTQSPNGVIFITINEDAEGNICEVFLNSGKNGSDIMAIADALGRMISLILRMQSPMSNEERVGHIIKELKGLGGSRHIGFGKETIKSFSDAVAKILERHYTTHKRITLKS